MDPKHAQHLIDERILDLEHTQLIPDLQRTVRDLKSQRNTLAYIWKVPNEILAEIFVLVRSRVASQVSRWHHVAHVCQRWRDVAFGLATLWSRPPPELYDYTVAMLGRSGNRLLDIDFSRCYEDVSEWPTTGLLIAQIPRARSISLAWDSMALRAIHSVLSSPHHDNFPLQIFRGTPPSGNETFRLRVSTFSRTSSLTTLVLRSTVLNWQIFPIPSLKSLTLSYTQIRVRSWEAFFRALAGMSLLEELSMDTPFFPRLSRNEGLASVCIPLLRKLSIEHTPAAIIKFMAHTTLPSLRKTCLWTCPLIDNSDEEDSEEEDANPVEEDDDGNDDDVGTDYDFNEGNKALLPQAMSLIHRGDFALLDTIKVKEEGFQMYSRMMQKGDSNIRPRLRYYSPDMDWFDNQDPSPMLQDVVSAICTLGDIDARIRFLEWDGWSFSEKDICLFQDFPQLESIRALYYANSATVIQSLSITSDNLGAVNSSKAIPFANVRTVCLLANDYSRGTFAKLCRCMATRKAFGVAITNLDVAWDLTEDEAERLGQTVGHLTYGSKRVRDDDGNDDEEYGDEEESDM